MYIVYEIRNKSNNRLYIGVTGNSVVGRFREHISQSKTKKVTELYDDARVIGWDSFEIKELESCETKEFALERENYWISVRVSDNFYVYNKQNRYKEGIVSIKVYESSRDDLKVISALKKETNQETIKRVLSEELSRIKTK